MSFVAIERDGDVAILRLARPPVNAFNLAFMDEAAAATARLREAPDVAAVVLTGAGAHFSAGLDLKEVPLYGPEDQRAMVAKANRAMLDLHGFPKPVVAALNGSAIAGGLVFALACDFRVGTTAPTCKIGLTEVRAGIPFPAVALAIVRAELPAPSARRLLLGGRNVDPEAALALGILDELVPPERVLARACEVAKDLATASARAYAVTKLALRSATLAAMEKVVREDADPMMQAWLAPDSAAASRALLRGGA
jgi:enoyl-CoA hydratase